MPAHPTLSTPRLNLRPWRPEDLAPFAALNGDPRVMEFFPTRLDRAESDAMVAKIWDMYQSQLRRTHEMMLLYETQRQELEEAKRQLYELTIVKNEAERKPRKERDKPLDPITFDEVEKLSKYLKDALYISKSSYANALIKMLYTLNQLKGRATAAHLFASAEITEVSCSRDISAEASCAVCSVWARTIQRSLR